MACINTGARKVIFWQNKLRRHSHTLFKVLNLQQFKQEYCFLRSNCESPSTRNSTVCGGRVECLVMLSVPDQAISPWCPQSQQMIQRGETLTSKAPCWLWTPCQLHKPSVAHQHPQGMHRANLWLPQLQMWHLAKSLHGIRDNKNTMKRYAATESLSIAPISVRLCSSRFVF